MESYCTMNRDNIEKNKQNIMILIKYCSSVNVATVIKLRCKVMDKRGVLVE